MTFQECVDDLDQYKGKPVLHATRHRGIGRMSKASLTCFSLEVFCKHHKVFEEVHLQWERARSRGTEMQLSSPDKTTVLICERQGQLTPAELAARLATCFLQSWKGTLNYEILTSHFFCCQWRLN